ncbi:hypothetical protein U0070_024371 [Myodes glareolus]|uniref:J domain-containing protein n=1 Tax=Myodes glareolus TaxID=447135 RepID=A0AAW0IKV3_MYOGA
MPQSREFGRVDVQSSDSSPSSPIIGGRTTNYFKRMMGIEEAPYEVARTARIPEDLDDIICHLEQRDTVNTTKAKQNMDGESKQREKMRPMTFYTKRQRQLAPYRCEQPKSDAQKSLGDTEDISKENKAKAKSQTFIRRWLEIETETHIGAHWSFQSPEEEQKEGEHEKGSQDRDGCVHPQRRCDRDYKEEPTLIKWVHHVKFWALCGEPVPTGEVKQLGMMAHSINPSTRESEVQNQGYELAHPNIHPIYELLEYVKELVLQIQSSSRWESWPCTLSGQHSRADPDREKADPDGKDALFTLLGMTTVAKYTAEAAKNSIMLLVEIDDNFLANDMLAEMSYTSEYIVVPGQDSDILVHPFYNQDDMAAMSLISTIMSGMKCRYKVIQLRTTLILITNSRPPVSTNRTRVTQGKRPRRGREAGPFGYVHRQLGHDWKLIPAERKLPAERKVGSALRRRGLTFACEAWLSDDGEAPGGIEASVLLSLIWQDVGFYYLVQSSFEFIVDFKVALVILCRPGCPGAHRDQPVFAYQYHPDKQSADAPAGTMEKCMQKFIEIDQAWKILGNEETKKMYDLQRHGPDDGSFSLTCRCGGKYTVSKDEVEEVQEGECPDRLDPQNPVYAEETSPSVIVNGFSERLRASHNQRIRPHSENLTNIATTYFIGSQLQGLNKFVLLQSFSNTKLLQLKELNNFLGTLAAALESDN